MYERNAPATARDTDTLQDSQEPDLAPPPAATPTGPTFFLSQPETH
jgi:hypothetical protein